MEFVLLLAVILFFFFRARKRNSDHPQISPELAQRQSRYLKQMNTSPRLRGNGSFANQVAGEHAYQESLTIVKQMLVQDYSLDSTFMAVLAAEPTNSVDPNAVRVLVGDEIVGYLPACQAAVIQTAILQFGGEVIAEARLTELGEAERIEIELDFVIPLEIAK